MPAQPTRKIPTLLSSAVATALILSASFSYADDTEIFFGGPAIDEGIRPNVLFVLDNSGSMNWRLDSNNTASSSQTSRLQVLKSSFSDIINNANDINVGVMVLNARSEYDSSRFVYPINYIDKNLPGDSELVANPPAIRQSADDAIQPVSPLGNTRIDDPALVMGVIDATHPIPGQSVTSLITTGSFFRQMSNNVEYACRFSPPNRTASDFCKNSTQYNLDLKRSTGNVALFHFQEINLPAGATITDAYLEVSPTNSPSNSNRRPYINVQVENNKTPAALNDSNPVGNRTYQSSRQVQVEGWTSSNRVLINILSEITKLQVAPPAADPIQGTFIRLSNTSINNSNNQEYSFCVHGCAVGKEPILTIKYTADGLVPEKRMGALRFQEVGIPQGAMVTSARLSFVPAAANSDPVTFKIKAEASDDASAFANNSSLINRSKTSAVVTWEAPEWSNQATPAPIPGPDVTGLVQEVVNRSGWCGNNSMAFYLDPHEGSGSRTAHSFDSSGGLQPTLTVSYTGGDQGCFNSVIETRITTNANDGYQDGSGNVNLGASTLPLTASQIAARFENLPIAPGAEVMSAQLLITPTETVNSPSLNYYVSFQNSATASALAAGRNNFSNRSSRTSESTCSINSTEGWNADLPLICDISGQSSALTTIFAQSTWARGNALNLFIRPQQNSSLLIKSFESNPGQSIRLRLKIRNGGLIQTVRHQVNYLVQSMNAEGGTPIVPTYWDAVKYFRGSISGKTSPIESACQANHIVLLTDGQASGNGAQSSISQLIGSCSGDASLSDEQCARSLSAWISKNDQSSIAGDNYITTHTVGFALDASGATTSANIKKFLKEVAEKGGGSFNTAENASELSDAFNRIIQEVLATDTSFVSASAPVNSFERSDNKDELYFSLFRPQETNRWPGNLKRYRYAMVDANGNPNPHIVDANNLPAVDSLTGQFADGAKSFWSSSVDGNNTASGGAASVLPSSRNALTYIGNTITSLVSLVAINSTTTAITQALLGATDATEREDLIKYVRGIDPTTGSARKALGDPIHSSPRLATYSCETKENGTCTVADQTAFIGTNEGYLHAFNTKTGAEQFAFMPQELLSNIKLLKENNRSSSLAPRKYGMDNPVVLWTNDANGDGEILSSFGSSTAQPGEFIYAYGTMGRGGRNIYALDVTNRNSPKLMWFIKGGETPGFEQLGQTWSAPVKTRIRIGNNTEPTDVLMFAGGYDPNQDNVKVRTTDSVGNAVYIVNAKTGALIWSASNTTGHTQVLSKMQYSMPGNLRVIDMNVNAQGKLTVDSEKLADQFFIGDMGGQVWRFFINNGKSGALVTPGGNGWTTTSGGDGIFATAIPAGYDQMDETNKQKYLRRFYNEPDAALLNQDGRLSLSINIGSGHRGHPLEMITEDAFYSFRTAHLGGAGEGTITTADMFDTTNTLLTSVTTPQAQQTAKGQLNPTTEVNQNGSNVSKGGWYIRLTRTGEKVLTRALTTGQDSIVFFNTYTPGSSTNANSCKAAFGNSRGYAVSLYDAMPYTKWLTAAPTLEDRWTDLKTSGIPPQPEQICIGNTCSVILSPDKIEEVEMPAQGKMYWIDDTQL